MSARKIVCSTCGQRIDANSSGAESDNSKHQKYIHPADRCVQSSSSEFTMYGEIFELTATPTANPVEDEKLAET